MEEALHQLEAKKTEGGKDVRDLEKCKVECGKLQKAVRAKQRMEVKSLTRVVRLDGARTMRSTTTNEMNDMLDVCVLERNQGGEQSMTSVKTD